MSKFNVSNPSGFPEFSPAEEQVRQSWLKIIRETYAKYGFQTITTPLVEREENLLGKGGNPKEMYVLKRLLDEDNDKSHSGNALRFDHTVPLALYVTRHLNDIAFPFKRQAIGPVLRGERAQKGRFRQFDQCDIDVIGRENLPVEYDAEMILVISEIFERLNLGKFMIRINNRKIFRGFFASLGISEGNMKPVLDIVDDLEKFSATDLKKRFDEYQINPETAKKILDFTQQSGNTIEFLDQARKITDEAMFQAGCDELEMVLNVLEAAEISAENYEINFSIARGLDYYTGTVYETKLVDHLDFGSVCGGGRYEDLAKVFTGKSFPGVGISIGLTRLLSQSLEAGLVEVKQASPSQVLIIAMSSAQQSLAIKIGAKLRNSEISAENLFGKKKIAKQFDYANKLGIPYVIVIGEDEAAKKTVILKDMKAGKQQEISAEKLGEVMKELV